VEAAVLTRVSEAWAGGSHAHRERDTIAGRRRGSDDILGRSTAHEAHGCYDGNANLRLRWQAPVITEGDSHATKLQACEETRRWSNSRCVEARYAGLGQ
jgi:hypothetical protein